MLKYAITASEQTNLLEYALQLRDLVHGVQGLEFAKTAIYLDNQVLSSHSDFKAQRSRQEFNNFQGGWGK